MKTIAITGAAGVVGTALRPELTKRGYRLVLLDRQSIGDCGAHERAVLIDICDQPALTNSLMGCEAVVHLAACTTDAPWPEQVKLSVEGTISLFDAARDAGVNRIVYASSHHVVGFHGRDAPIDAHAMLLPDSRYGVGKAFGEQIGALYACKFGLQVLAIRIGNVNTRPIDRRRLGSWISHRDLGSLVTIGIEHPDVVFDIVYGISDTTGRNYDNRRAYELGYKPQDKSAPYEAEVLRHDPAPVSLSAAAALPAEMTLGGQFSAVEYVGTTDRLRRLRRR